MKRAKATKTRTSLPAYLNTLGAMQARANPHLNPAFLKKEAALGWEGIGATEPAGNPDEATIDGIFAPGAFAPFHMTPEDRPPVIARIDVMDWDSTGGADGNGLARFPMPDPLQKRGQLRGRTLVTDALHLPLMNAFFDLRSAQFTPGDLSDAIIWAIKTDTDIARSSAELSRLRFLPPTNGDRNHALVTDGSATYLIKHGQCNERIEKLFGISKDVFVHLAVKAYEHATDLRSRVNLLRALIARDDLVVCRYWIATEK